MSSTAQARPQAFLPNWPARIAWLALAAYAFYAASILDISWERFVIGLDNGVTTELTSTTRTAMARFTYPAGAKSTLLLHASGSIEGVHDAALKAVRPRLRLRALRLDRDAAHTPAQQPPGPPEKRTPPTRAAT